MKFDRLNDMEQYILHSGASSLEELCRHYAVSISTIRRDVAELSRRNRVQKVYGGVTRSQTEQPNEAGTALRPQPSPDQTQIGPLAASFVKEGMSVFLDSGDMVLEVLPYLAEMRSITVISHSLTVLAKAAGYSSLNVIALGGIYNSETASFSGKSALEELSKMSIDLVFLTAGGVSIERGLTSSSYTEIEVKRNVAKWNRDIVLLADGTEFGKSALITFCEIGRLRAVVSEAPAPTELRQANTLRRVAFFSAQADDAATEPTDEESLPFLRMI